MPPQLLRSLLAKFLPMVVVSRCACCAGWETFNEQMSEVMM